MIPSMWRALASIAIGFGLTATAHAEPRRALMIDVAEPPRLPIDDFERALRPQLEAADTTLEIVPGDPDRTDEASRAAWGGEVAQRRAADATLWIEPGPGEGEITVWVVHRSRHALSFVAAAGDPFDQQRTLALATRSLLERTARAAEAGEGGVDTAEAEPAGPPIAPVAVAPGTAPRAGPARYAIAPFAALGPTVRAGSGATAGVRLGGGVRIARHLALALAGELLLPERFDTGEPPAATDRQRALLALQVLGILPVATWGDLRGGVAAGLALSAVSRGATGGRPAADELRVGPFGALLIAGHVRLVGDLFLEVPISLDIRLGGPPGNSAFDDDDAIPPVEASAGILVGLEGS